jgi:hypothetical protein
MPPIHRFVAATLTAFAGAAAMVAIMLPDWPLDPVLVSAAAAGAFVAGLAAARFFGQSGRQGHLTAAAAAILTTLAGAGVAGFAIGLIEGLPLQGGLIAVVFVAIEISTTPHALLVWLVAMSGVHLVMLALRRTPPLAS